MSKQVNVDLRFNADTSQAKASIQDLQMSLNKLSAGSFDKTGLDATKINQASQAAKELSIHLSNAFNANTGKLDLSKLNASLATSKTSLSSLTTQIMSVGTSGQQAFVSLAQSIAAAERPTITLSARMQSLWTTMKNTMRWQISSSVLTGMVSSVQKAFDYAENLNRSLNDIRIVSGQNTEQMAEFAQKANAAAKALSTTTNEYAKGSLIYFQQGLSSEEVEKRTAITVKMANVTGESTQKVSDQLTAIWNNFYDGSKSLEYYADVLTKLGAATASSTDEIAGGLEKFAAIGETIGLSYEYAAAALATITANTRQSEEVVGTALKTIFARIQGLKMGDSLEDGVDLNKYSEALQAVGISIFESNGELKEMDNILDEMGAKWGQLSKAEQTALAQTVAGVRQYTQVMALMNEWDSGDSDSMMANLGHIGDADGELQQQADIYAESWEAASKRVQASAETIYQALLDDKFFISLNHGFADLLGGLGEFIEGIGGLKGVLAIVSSFFLSAFAGKIGPAINEVKHNLMILFQTAQQQAVATAGQLNPLIETMMGRSDLTWTKSQEVALQNADRLNSAKIALQGVEKNLTNEEKQRYNLELSFIEAAQRESQQIADNITKRKQELELLSQDNVDSKATADIDKKILKNADKAENENITDAELIALDQETEMLQRAGAQRQSYVQQIQKQYDIQMQASQGNIQNSNAEISVMDLLGNTAQNLFEDLQTVSNMDWGQELFAKTQMMRQEFEQIAGKTCPDVVNALKQLENSSKADLSKNIAAVKTALENAKIPAKDLDGIMRQFGQVSHVKEVSNNYKRLRLEEEQLAQKQKEVNSLMSQFKPTHVVTGLEAINSTAAGLGQVAMGITSIYSAFRALANEDMSWGEKLSTVLMSVSMVVPSVIGVLTNYGKILGYTRQQAELSIITSNGLTVATNKNIVANYQEIASMKAEEVAQKLGIGQDKAEIAIKQAKELLLKNEILSINKGIQGKQISVTATKLLNMAEQQGIATDRLKTQVKKAVAAGNQKELLSLFGLTSATEIKTAATKKEIAAMYAKRAAQLILNPTTLAAIAIIGVLTAAIYGSIKAYNAEEDALQKSKTKVAEASQAYEDAKQAYDSFKSNLDAYSGELKNLDSLKEGTIEYTEAILKANEAGMKLVETLGLAYGTDYWYNDKGLLQITKGAIQKGSEQLINNQTVAQYQQQRAQLERQQNEANLNQKQFARKSSSLNNWKQQVKQVDDGATTLENFTLFASGSFAGGIPGALLGIGAGIVNEINQEMSWIDKLETTTQSAFNDIANEYKKNMSDFNWSEDNLEKILRNTNKYDEEFIQALNLGSSITSKLIQEEIANTQALNALTKALVHSTNINDEYYKHLTEDEKILMQSVVANRIKKEQSEDPTSNRGALNPLEAGLIREGKIEERGIEDTKIKLRADLGYFTPGQGDAELYKEFLKYQFGDSENYKIVDTLGEGVTLLKRNIDETGKENWEKKEWNGDDTNGLTKTEIANIIAESRQAKITEEDEKYFNKLNSLALDLTNAGKLDSGFAQQMLSTIVDGEKINFSALTEEQVNNLKNYVNSPMADMSFEPGNYNTGKLTDEYIEFKAQINEFEFDEAAFKNAQKLLAEGIISSGAQELELSEAAVEAYADSLKKLNKDLNLTDKQAAEMAVSNLKMSKSMGVVNEAIDDLDQILKEQGENSYEYIETFGELQTALENAFDVDLDSEFINKYLGTIREAANGSTQALNELRIAAAQTNFDNMTFDANAFANLEPSELSARFGTAITSIDALQEQFLADQQILSSSANDLLMKVSAGQIQANQDVYDVLGEDFVQSMNNMAQVYGWTTEEMTAQLDKLNVTTELTTIPAQVTEDIPNQITESTLMPDFDDNPFTWKTKTNTYTEGTTPITYTKQVAQINVGDKAQGKKPKLTYLPKTHVPTPPSNNNTTKNGGGSTNKSSKPVQPKKIDRTDNLKELDEEVERYIEIKHSLEDMDDVLSEIADNKDRAFGMDKLKYFDQEQAALDKSIKYYSKYNKQVAEKKNDDKWNVKAFFGVGDDAFDENGRLIDETGLREQLALDYNAEENRIDDYEQGIEDERARLENQKNNLSDTNDDGVNDQAISDIETQLDNLGINPETGKAFVDEWREANDKNYETGQKYLKQWNDTLEEEKEARLNYLETIRTAATLALEYAITKLEEFGNQLDQLTEWVEFTQEMRYWDTEAFENQSAIAGEKLAAGVFANRKGATETVNTIADMFAGNYQFQATDENGKPLEGQYLAAGTEAYWARVKEFVSEDGLPQLQEYMTNWKESIVEAQETLVESIGAATEEFESAMEASELYADSLDRQRSLIETIGKTQKSYYRNLNRILEAEEQVLADRLDSEKDFYTFAENQYKDQKEKYEQALTSGDKEIIALQKQLLDESENRMYEAQSKVDDTLQAMVENFKAQLQLALEEAGEELEKNIFGDMGMEFFMTELERFEEEQERYLTTTNKMYETNKLIRQAALDMDATENKAAKQRYAAYMKETEELQKQGNVSQYDLERQQKKYELLKAQIALEEAQDAKSQVRLQRDSEGNYGYVYTADQDAINDAEGAVADAQNALYNLDLERTKEMYSLGAQAAEEYYNELREIAENEELSEEEKIARQEAAWENYQKKKLYISDEFSKAQSNLEDTSFDRSSEVMLERTHIVEVHKEDVDRYREETEAADEEYTQKTCENNEEVQEVLGTTRERIENVTTASSELAAEVTDNVIPTIENEAEAMEELNTKVVDSIRNFGALQTIMGDLSVDQLMDKMNLWYTEFNDQMLEWSVYDKNKDFYDSLGSVKDWSLKMANYIQSGGKFEDDEYRLLERKRQAVLDQMTNEQKAGLKSNTELRELFTAGNFNPSSWYTTSAIAELEDVLSDNTTTSNALLSSEEQWKIIEDWFSTTQIDGFTDSWDAYVTSNNFDSLLEMLQYGLDQQGVVVNADFSGVEDAQQIKAALLDIATNPTKYRQQVESRVPFANR